MDTDAPLLRKWITVTFHKNYGTDQTVKRPFPCDYAAALLSDQFPREGYTIQSWNTKANGEGDNYSVSSGVKLTSDIDLYAQWKPKITITLYIGVGSDYTVQYMFSDIPGKLIECPFIVKGHSFAGWKDPSGNIYAAGQEVSFSRDALLYAQWGPLVINGGSTADDPYFVITDTDWNVLADYVAAGNDTSGMYFRQIRELTASKPIGGDGAPFKGVYDGNGCRIKSSIGGGEFAAPFSRISGAVIKNLKAAGSVSGGMHSAGLVGGVNGEGNVIENCRVSVSVSSSGTYCGGIVGHAGTSGLSVKGCVFSGTISDGKTAGTLIGWSDSGARITLADCLDDSSTAYPLVSGASKSVSASKVYYTASGKAADTYGEIVYSVNAGANVSLSVYGYADSYLAAELTFFGDAVKYGQKYCMREGGTAGYEFTYTLAVKPGQRVAGFSASAGTLTPAGDIYHCSLTMPKGPVTISAVIEGEADPIPYLNPDGSEGRCAEYTVLQSGGDLTDGWYILNDSLKADYVYVTGNVNLILCDGINLTLKDQFTVDRDCSLTIWAQSEGEGAGSIVCKNNDGIRCYKGSSLTVNGGNITSEGKSTYAGIRCYEGSSLTVNGGSVTAKGTRNAGIECSHRMNPGTVVINGGIVKAEGGTYGAGIGGSERMDCGIVIINGGDVTAIGGYGAAGIGGGKDGGGAVDLSGVYFSSVTITGGNVTAIGGDEAAGIGGGENGGGVDVAITGGTVTAIGSEVAAGIGGGYKGRGADVSITGGTVTATGTMAIGKSQRAKGDSYYDAATGEMVYEDIAGKLEIGGETGLPYMKVGISGEDGSVSWVAAADRVSACRNEEEERTVVIMSCDHNIGESGVCEWCGCRPVPGDVDGDGIPCTLRDAIVLARYIAGWKDYDKMIILPAADLDGDGKVTPKDAMILARHISGWKGYEKIPVKP